MLEDFSRVSNKRVFAQKLGSISVNYTIFFFETIVFDQFVLSMMIYGTETWSLTVGLMKRLKVT